MALRHTENMQSVTPKVENSPRKSIYRKNAPAGSHHLQNAHKEKPRVFTSGRGKAEHDVDHSGRSPLKNVYHLGRSIHVGRREKAIGHCMRS